MKSKNSITKRNIRIKIMKEKNIKSILKNYNVL